MGELRKLQSILVIVAYHGGFERDLDTNEAYVVDTGENLGSKIINNIKGIDCLITAHQHRTSMLKKLMEQLLFKLELEVVMSLMLT